VTRQKYKTLRQQTPFSNNPKHRKEGRYENTDTACTRRAKGTARTNSQFFTTEVFMNNRTSYFCLLAVLLLAAPIFAQTNATASATSDSAARNVQSTSSTFTTKSAQDYLDSLFEAKYNKPSPFQFGVSVGYRWLVGHDSRPKEYSISVLDKTLQENDRDWADFVLSATLAVYPFAPDDNTNGWHYLGFIANLNLADFSNGQFNAIGTKSVEGGLGLALRLNNHFALSCSIDRVFHRQLREHLVALLAKPDPKDRQISIAGTVITRLDKSDDALFRDNNLTGLLFKFVYTF
jgi:hypothetical protein